MLILSGRRAPHLPRNHPSTCDTPTPILLQKLRALGGTPEQVLNNPEWLELMLPTLRADFSICDAFEYVYEPSLEVPLRVMGGREDVNVPEASLRGWSGHTCAGFGCKMFPGGHFFIHSERAAVIAHIRELLEAARKGDGLADQENADAG
jgi:surfactin synthase thioesterase subunit